MKNICAICHQKITEKTQIILVDNVIICKSCSTSITTDLGFKKYDIKTSAFTYLRNQYAEKELDIFMHYPENKTDDLSAFKYVKKPSSFWKGDSTSGFLLGLIFGLVVGLINIIFFHIPFMGFIFFIATWLFIGTNPKVGIAVSKWMESGNKSSRSPATSINSVKIPKIKHHLGDLYCPRCKSSNVQLMNDHANIKSTKTKTKVTANLNPLHPLTIANVKTTTKVKKKKSGTKVAAALMSGGTSMMVTGGLKSNKSMQYHCLDCGNTFKK